MVHRRRIGLAGALASALLTTVLAGGCADYSQLLFVKDDRLEFTSPEDYAKVEVPFTITWTMADFEILPKDSTAEPTDDAGYFAVFVDRAPIKPGATLEDVGKDDAQCRTDPRCPDKQYLNANGVYVTRKTSVTLDNVVPLTSKEKVQLHQVTVILLDSEGTRIGEYAWFIRFKAENRTFGT